MARVAALRKRQAAQHRQRDLADRQHIGRRPEGRVAVDRVRDQALAVDARGDFEEEPREPPSSTIRGHPGRRPHQLRQALVGAVGALGAAGVDVRWAGRRRQTPAYRVFTIETASMSAVIATNPTVAHVMFSRPCSRPDTMP